MDKVILLSKHITNIKVISKAEGRWEKGKYIAGYEELTENLLMFICSTIKEELSNAEGLKSYGIRGINYTFLNKIEQSDNFIRGVKDLFGVVEIW